MDRPVIARSRDGRKRMATPIADALAFARRPRNSLAKPSATRQSGEGARGRHHFAPNRKAIQMGRDPSGSPRWRAEGDGARAVRRGPGEAGYAGRPHPALAPRPWAQSL